MFRESNYVIFIIEIWHLLVNERKAVEAQAVTFSCYKCKLWDLDTMQFSTNQILVSNLLKSNFSANVYKDSACPTSYIIIIFMQIISTKNTSFSK